MSHELLCSSKFNLKYNLIWFNILILKLHLKRRTDFTQNRRVKQYCDYTVRSYSDVNEYV